MSTQQLLIIAGIYVSLLCLTADILETTNRPSADALIVRGGFFRQSSTDIELLVVRCV